MNERKNRKVLKRPIFPRIFISQIFKEIFGFLPLKFQVWNLHSFALFVVTLRQETVNRYPCTKPGVSRNVMGIKKHRLFLPIVEHQIQGYIENKTKQQHLPHNSRFLRVEKCQEKIKDEPSTWGPFCARDEREAEPSIDTLWGPRRSSVSTENRYKVTPARHRGGALQKTPQK